MKNCFKNGIADRFPMLILLCFLCIPIAFGCDTGDSGTEPDPQKTKIADEDIRGTWLKATEEGDVDTAIFTENQLRAPCAEDGAGDYYVENGRIIVGDTVVAEYEIAADTLYIEALIAIEPDGIIDRESATKYVKLFTEPDDTGNTNPPVTNGEMDPVGKDIPVGLAMTYTDSFYTAGMELIEAAWDTFSMGIEDREHEKYHYHPVCLTYDYYIGKFEVTCSEYCDAINYAKEEGYVDFVNRERFGENVFVVANTYGEERHLLNIGDEKKRMGYSKSKDGIVPLFNGQYPAVFVSWYGAAFYCNMLSEQCGLEKVYDLTDWSINYKANGYRLPTNAEHEYATRAGKSTLYFWGDNWKYNERYVVDVAESQGVVPVGSKYNNEYGLYDIVGNAYEFCNDWFATTYYFFSPSFNPVGPGLEFLTIENTVGINAITKRRVLRSNHGESSAQSGHYQSTEPGDMSKYFGLRIVLPVKNSE